MFNSVIVNNQKKKKNYLNIKRKTIAKIKKMITFLKKIKIIMRIKKKKQNK